MTNSIYMGRRFVATTQSLNTYEVVANNFEQDRDSRAGFHVYRNAIFHPAMPLTSETDVFLGEATTVHSDIHTKRLVMEGDLSLNERDASWISTSPVLFMEYTERWDVV